MRGLLVVLIVATGCRKGSPEADPEFSDAARFLFRTMEGSQADAAFALRALEKQVYLGMDVQADRVQDRALEPKFLEPDDVTGLNVDGGDLSLALPVSVAGLSAFDIDVQTSVQMLPDHTPVEPYSPDHYERTFLDGEDCWSSRDCEWLRTDNDLTKDNALMTVDYAFFKDFRWVDMALPDPSTVPEGEEALNTGEPRWAFVGRSWTDQVYPGRSGNVAIVQSYTIEAWIPRDGRGFVRDGSEENLDGGDWTTDSTGGGTLRNLTLWAETDLGFSVGDDMVIGTTRAGIDDNFQAAEDWLGEQSN